MYQYSYYNILMFNHQFRLRFAAGNRNKTVHDLKKKKGGNGPFALPVFLFVCLFVCFFLRESNTSSMIVLV